MAAFEFDSNAFDDILEELQTITVPCPECGESFDISVDDMDSSVICPHCKSTISIESE